MAILLVCKMNKIYAVILFTFSSLLVSCKKDHQSNEELNTTSTMASRFPLGSETNNDDETVINHVSSAPLISLSPPLEDDDWEDHSPLLPREEWVYDAPLMWQDNRDVDILLMRWDQAKQYCEDLTLGGYHDWRLPLLDEFFRITDPHQYQPSLQATFFHRSSDAYWSATPYPLDDALIFGLNFYDGSDGMASQNSSYHVRCVRGTLNAFPSFAKEQNETVLDTTQQLLWQDNIATENNFPLSHSQAEAYCEDLELDHLNNWRLPTISELRTLIDRSQSNPALSPVFQDRINSFVWSSSIYAPNPSKVWSIFFTDGNDYPRPKEQQGYVRCVTEITF